MKRCAICRREIAAGLIVDRECLVRLKRAAASEFATEILLSLNDAKQLVAKHPFDNPDDTAGYLNGLEAATSVVKTRLSVRLKED